MLLIFFGDLWEGVGASGLTRGLIESWEGFFIKGHLVDLYVDLWLFGVDVGVWSDGLPRLSALKLFKVEIEEED